MIEPFAVKSTITFYWHRGDLSESQMKTETKFKTHLKFYYVLR